MVLGRKKKSKIKPYFDTQYRAEVSFRRSAKVLMTKEGSVDTKEYYLIIRNARKILQNKEKAFLVEKTI